MGLSDGEFADGDAPVVVIGAGLAGLCCALDLADAGVRVVVLESSDRPGGRVATDVHPDGFLLDRGFQVLLDSYPCARERLDYQALGLGKFEPGAVVVDADGKRTRVIDPFRRPVEGIMSLPLSVLGVGDAVRIARMRRPESALWCGWESLTTAELLDRLRFTRRSVERFFRPFFSGVFLERELATPASFFRFIFTMFAAGSATLPKDGMGAIAGQLADRLPEGSLRLGAAVTGLEGADEPCGRDGARDGGVIVVTLASGEKVRARGVVVATDADAARVLLRGGEVAGSVGVGGGGWRSCTTLSYAAESSPTGGEAMLLLAGRDYLALSKEGEGPINHVAVMSDVQPAYAPAGASLVSATAIGVPTLDDSALDRATRDQLRGWFGHNVDRWRLLRVDRVARALPAVFGDVGGTRAGLRRVHVCGDWTRDPSINGAMESGGLAAEVMLKELGLLSVV